MTYVPSAHAAVTRGVSMKWINVHTAIMLKSSMYEAYYDQGMNEIFIVP